MSVTEIKLSGLFTLVRHQMRALSEDAEPMTMVFPNSEFGDHGARHLCGGLHTMPAKHQPILYIDKSALAASPDTLPANLKPIATSRPLPDMVSYDLSRWQVWLPLTIESGAAVRRDVRHEKEIETFDTKEPVSCTPMSKELFRALTRLPDLRTLTKVEIEPANVKGTPAPAVVESRVLLSGGKLEGLLNAKPLSRAFFEFFERSGSVVIQPALEDLLYYADLEAEHLVLGFRHLDDAVGPIHSFRLKVVSGKPNVEIASLPDSDDEHVDIRPALQHFSHYYELMAKSGRRAPAVRFLGLCSDERAAAVTHTMPATRQNGPSSPDRAHQHEDHGTHDPLRVRRRRTDETCSCLAAQVLTTTTPE